MTKPAGWLAPVLAAVVLAACGQGAGVFPAGGSSRDPATLKAIAIVPSPTPTPSPGLIGGLVGTVVGVVSDLGCGALGLTCQILPGAGTQGLPAGTPANQLPGLHPADLQNAYALPSATAGAGQVVGIVVAYDNPKLEADLGVYRSTYGLPPCTTANGCFRKIAPLLIGGNQTWGQESSLDVQVVSAVCPNCRIVVVEAGSDSPDALLSAAKTAVAQGATVVSDSYSLAEYSGENDAAYAIGVAFVFGAGDSGARAQWPASSSHVIAVGGTSLHRDGTTARGWTESVWSSSGGGCSGYVAKPAWQHDGGCAKRTSNDIAAFADPNPGVSVYDSYLSSSPGWRTYGGTSASAPIVAGAIALAGNGKQLVDAAYIYAHASALNAITSGSNGSCGTYLCSAGSGYSAPAGNGSPRGIGAL